MLRWAQTQEFSDLLAYYKGLIALRKQMPGLYDKSPAAYARISQETVHAPGVVSFLLNNRSDRVPCPWTRLWILYNASQQTASVPAPPGRWSVLADGVQVGEAQTLDSGRRRRHLRAAHHRHDSGRAGGSPMKYVFGKYDWATLARGEAYCYLMTNGLGGFFRPDRRRLLLPQRPGGADGLHPCPQLPL